MAEAESERELWILGLGDREERGTIVRGYLTEGGYRARTATLQELADGRPLGVVLDISPYSADGWGTGPSIDRGGRWDPGDVGDAVRELIQKSVPPQKVYGT